MITKTIGIILFRRQGQKLEYLLLHHGGQYWNFPKGRVEPDEEGDELKTAFREVKEETGIAKKYIKLVPGFKGSYAYSFIEPEEWQGGEKVLGTSPVLRGGGKRKINKRALFFLGEVVGGEVKISDEHIGFGWFDYDEALEKLYYKAGKDVLKRAHQVLLN
jgi:8-oxo-dGTP pyrophosphatase MutT (NUDIX family)